MPKESRGFRYQKRTADDVRSRANASSGSFDSIVLSHVKVFKPRDGKNIIRILPPTWKDANHYGYDLYVNYGIGADNQSYLSLSKMKNEKDPLTEARREAERAGDKDLVKALNPRKRMAYWLVDRDAEEEGPQFWSAPLGFDKDLANVCYDPDTKEVIFIDDPETGCDLRFFKEGTGLKTKYEGSKMKLLKPSYLHEDEQTQNDWLDYITENPLPDVLQFYDYDYISTMFDGEARIEKPEDDATEERPARGGRGKPDAEEEEAPARSARPARGERRGRGDVADTEAEEEAPFEADPPARGRRGRAEPEDEPAPRQRARVNREPEPDAEEETPPARGARRGRSEPEPEAESGSIKDRLRRRRAPSADSEDD